MIVSVVSSRTTQGSMCPAVRPARAVSTYWDSCPGAGTVVYQSSHNAPSDAAADNASAWASVMASSRTPCPSRVGAIPGRVITGNNLNGSCQRFRRSRCPMEGAPAEPYTEDDHAPRLRCVARRRRYRDCSPAADAQGIVRAACGMTTTGAMTWKRLARARQRERALDRAREQRDRDADRRIETRMRAENGPSTPYARPGACPGVCGCRTAGASTIPPWILIRPKAAW